MIYFNTVLGQEKIDKANIWRLLDDNGNILYENPSNNPNQPSQPTVRPERAVPAEPTQQAPTPKQAETRPEPSPSVATAKSGKVKSLAATTDWPYKYHVELTGGLYGLGMNPDYTSSEYTQDMKGTINGIFGIEGAFYFPNVRVGEAAVGVTAGYEKFSSTLEEKECETCKFDGDYHYLKVGACLQSSIGGVSVGYLSLARRLKQHNTDIETEDESNGFYADIKYILPVSDNFTVSFGYGWNVIDKKNRSGGQKLILGVGLLL